MTIPSNHHANKIALVAGATRGIELEVVDVAKTGVQMALPDEDGPTGTFTHLGETLPW